jgi:hypothetical protein
MTYSIGLKKVSPPSFFFCHKPSLFLNDLMENQVFDKIVCFRMKNFNASIDVFYLQ